MIRQAHHESLRKRFNLFAIYQVRSLSSPQRRTYRRAGFTIYLFVAASNFIRKIK